MMGRDGGWSPRQAMLVLVGANLLWAGSYTAGKEALRAISPLELNGMRFAIAGLILFPLLWYGRRDLRLRRRDLPRLAMLCLFGFVVNKQAEYTGLSLTGASDVALLIASESMFTAIMAWIVLREPVRREAVAGLLFGLFGVYLVIERGFGLPRMGGGTHLLGDLLVVLALISEAAYTIFGKAELDRHPGLLITAGGILGSLFVWVPVGLADVARNGVPHLDGAAWAGVLYMAVAATVIAYLAWMLALRYVSGASAAATLFLQPLVGTVLAVLVLGERPSWATLAGGLCIVIGVWIASRGEARAAARAVESEALVS